MRYPASEKAEIIRMVEQSPMPVKRTLEKLGIPRATFYRWYELHQSGGPEALGDRSPRSDRVWNRIPDDIRERIMQLALDEPALSPRQLAVRFTDTEKYFVSEASVYRLLDQFEHVSLLIYGRARSCEQRSCGELRLGGIQMAKPIKSNGRHRFARAPGGLVVSVYNKKRKVWFGTLIDDGWFSAAPDDTAVNRAIRTNNPGALNNTRWQRKRAGYVGETKPDGAGNKTTIYQAPEYGAAAWFFLLSDRYGFGASGHFDLVSLAKKYAGSNATDAELKAYTDGWYKWSNGVLRPDTVIHLASDDEMLLFAKAEFAHEAAAPSPVHDRQVLYGFAIERNTAIPVTS